MKDTRGTYAAKVALYWLMEHQKAVVSDDLNRRRLCFKKIQIYLDKVDDFLETIV